MHVCIFIDSLKAAIDRFQSRGQQLCKLLGIKESFNMSEFKAHRIFWGTQTWPPIHCFVHKFGRRDLLWKRSIDNPLSWKFLYIVFSPIILLFFILFYFILFLFHFFLFIYLFIDKKKKLITNTCYFNYEK